MNKNFQKLSIMNFNGWETLVCEELGVSPFFSSQIRFRVHHKLATNIAVTGEPGIGKSYDATDMARVNEGLKRNGEDKFTVDQVVFRHSAYMDLLAMNHRTGKPRLKMGKGIVFDEPSYSLGKRDWFKELQKVLVHTLESQRFLVHPLWIPIINLNLLDKTIRAYLIQFVVHVIGRGHALAYRVKPSQRVEKVYWYQLGELYYRMFDGDKCAKDTCLGCKSLPICQIFRAQYERKKRDIQFERYEQGKEEAQRKESSELTERQIEDIIEPVMDTLLTEKGFIDVVKIRLHLREKHGISVSSWKAYNIKRSLEERFREKFDH